MLAEFYNDLVSSSSDVEIVFVSSDSDEDSFNDYYKSMPWKALPFGSAKKEELSKKFGVRGIPTLIGKLYCLNFRKIFFH